MAWAALTALGAACRSRLPLIPSDALLSVVCRWREQLTRHLQELYCHGSAFYRLQRQVDNPDQRIASGERAALV
jgi:ABC-type uncharacterized transport system fused permease/ATPase subunit